MVRFFCRQLLSRRLQSGVVADQKTLLETHKRPHGYHADEAFFTIYEQHVVVEFLRLSRCCCLEHRGDRRFSETVIGARHEEGAYRWRARSAKPKRELSCWVSWRREHRPSSLLAVYHCRKSTPFWQTPPVMIRPLWMLGLIRHPHQRAQGQVVWVALHTALFMTAEGWPPADGSQSLPGIVTCLSPWLT